MNYNIQNFLFLSNVCTSDYYNKYLNNQRISPFECASYTENDFIILSQNFKYVDIDSYKYVSSKNIKILKEGYNCDIANLKLNIKKSKTFGYEFSFNNINDRIQAYYRHYEYNNESIEKINRRIDRFRNINKIPFFIFHITPCMQKTYYYNAKQFRELILDFLNINYKYKIVIAPYDILRNNIFNPKNMLRSNKIHEELMNDLDIFIRGFINENTNTI